jgi:nucleoside-diphosphate-sugar epimerase
MGSKKDLNILVTGGNGFVGLALCRRLIKEGYSVASFSRRPCQAHKKLGVRTILGDIRNKEEISKACTDIHAVFHTAAKVDMWGKYEDFYAVNVIGTNNLIEACHNNQVQYIINTSTASVVFDGKDIEGGNETLAYPTRGASYYSETKAIAEQCIIQANTDKLKTTSLRPHLIYGPGDTQLIPKIIEKARKGKIRRPGKRSVLIDTLHIDNFTEAQILAYNKLTEGCGIDGKTYFITNGKPVELWTFINSILKAHGIEEINKYIPRNLALLLAYIAEKISIISGKPPLLTQFLIKEMSTHHWFDITAAKKELGYNVREE